MKKNSIGYIAYIIIFALIIGTVNLSLHNNVVAYDGSSVDAAVCQQYDGVEYNKDDPTMNRCLKKMCDLVEVGNRTISGYMAGGAAIGTTGGAIAGGIGGSAAGGVGAAPGAFAGGIAGGTLGTFVGGGIGWIVDKFDGGSGVIHNMKCDKAKKQQKEEIDKANKERTAQKEKEREEEANKRWEKSCPQYTGDRYVPDMGAAMQCYEKGFCIVENGKYNCDKKAVADAKKADADKKAADGSSGSSGASGTPGTKNPSRAEGPLSGDGIGSDPVGDFLGFPAWNRDVHFSPGSEIGPQVMKIVLNITEILLRLAGIAAVIVIIYAGAMFIIGSYSSSPDGIAKAKTILINGVIGLIIAIAATAIVSFIAGSLKGK